MNLDAKKAIVRDFLHAQSTLVLSTVGEQGIAHSTPLFYVVADNLRLYWVSSDSSAHCNHIRTHPQAGVSVHNATSNWREIVGVQMRGLVLVASPDEREPILKRYEERFKIGALFSVALSTSTLYAFRPAWVRYIDNSQGFGYKFEFELD